MKNHNKAFGKILRRLRRDRGLTQEELAFEAELDRTYISLLELGTNSPTLDTMMTLAAALETPLDEIVRRMLALLTPPRPAAVGSK